MSVRCSLRVLFEDPFWIGVYERWDEGKYQACKVIFGAEPKDCTVYEDIVPGIKSAKKGGFMTCAIHDFSNEADTDVLKQYADHYITGWEDLL